MVEDLKTIASLLELPNLEEQTTKDINETIRILLEQYRSASNTPTNTAFSPFHTGITQENVNVILDEWLNGTQKEGD